MTGQGPRTDPIYVGIKNFVTRFLAPRNATSKQNRKHKIKESRDKKHSLSQPSNLREAGWNSFLR